MTMRRSGARHAIDINSPLDTVWRLDDLGSWPTWQTDITAARLDGAFNVGSSFEWTSHGFTIVRPCASNSDCSSGDGADRRADAEGHHATCVMAFTQAAVRLAASGHEQVATTVGCKMTARKRLDSPGERAPSLGMATTTSRQENRAS